MFTDEALESLGADLLTFLLNLYCVIVSHNLLNRLPEYRDHLAYVVCFAAHLSLLVLKLLFFFDTAFGKLLAAHAHILLGIVNFLFMFTLEVLLHPVHLFVQKLQVSATCRASFFLRELLLRISFDQEIRANFFKLRLYFVVFGLQIFDVQFLTLVFNN